MNKPIQQKQKCYSWENTLSTELNNQTLTEKDVHQLSGSISKKYKIKRPTTSFNIAAREQFRNELESHNIFWHNDMKKAAWSIHTFMLSAAIIGYIIKETTEHSGFGLSLMILAPLFNLIYALSNYYNHKHDKKFIEDRYYGAEYDPINNHIEYMTRQDKMTVLHEHAHAHAIQHQYTPHHIKQGDHDADFVGILCRLYADYFSVDEKYFIAWAQRAKLAVTPFTKFQKKYPTLITEPQTFHVY